MKARRILLILGIPFLLAYLAVGFMHADGDKSAGGKPSAAVEDIVYLRSPEYRLNRLSRLLNLTRLQKTGILSILRKADSSARAALKKGDSDIRKVLSEEQLEQFDGLKSDIEIPPDSQGQPVARLRPVRGGFGNTDGKREGGAGGQGAGGGMGGQRMGGAGGQGAGGGMGGQRMGGAGGQGAGGGMGGQRMGGAGGQGAGGGSPRGYCGDGICQEIESTKGVCPQDCDE